MKQEPIELLRKFKEEQENIKDKETTIKDVLYYGNIHLTEGNEDLQDEKEEKLFLLKKETNGKIELEFHTNNGIVATIGEEGNIIIDEKYKDKINSGNFLLQLKDVMPLSLNELEMVKSKSTKKKDFVKKETKEEDEKQELEQEEEKNTNNDGKNDIEIDLGRKITRTQTFRDLVPEAAKCDKVKVKRIDGTRFEFYGVGKEGEKIELTSLEQTEGTNPSESIVEVNKDGSKVETNQVLTMVKIKNGRNVGRQNEGFSVDIGQAGIPEVKYWVRDANDEYTSVPVNLKSTNQKRTEKEVRDYVSKEKNPTVDDNIDRAEKRIEESGKEQTTLRNIDDNQYNDDIELLIQEAANRCKMSVEGFREVYDRQKEETIEEKIESAEEEINEQFRGNDTRKR